MRPPSTPSVKSKGKERLRRRPWTIVLMVLWVLLFATPSHAEIFDQHQVKAVFLYNLTNFITWPSANDATNNRPFVIAVMGRDPLQNHLSHVVGRETFNGRKIIIKHYRSLAELKRQGSDLLFISEDQLTIWPQIRAIARSQGTLTVSDVKGFAHRGGMVSLLTLGRRITIEININEAKSNGFDISAKLLRLARIVNSGKDD